MPRTYVDNAYNRSAGRVGMPVGSCVISRSSGGGSSGGGSSGGGNYGGGSYSSERTYVDNAFNRREGRVGMPVGTAVVSRSSTGSSHGNSSSERTYVDNAFNRREGRVGMSVGSAVVSRSSAGRTASGSTSGRCYVDNAYNRRLGRVGLPLGSAPNSTSSSSTTGQNRTYVDNAFNRKLGRVGKPIGTAVYKPNASQSRDRQCRTKMPAEIFGRLCNFDPEDPGLGNLYESLTTKMQENVDNPETYFDCEKALGILNRHDAAIALARSKNFERPKWLKGGEIVEWSNLEIGAKLGSGGFGDVHVAIWRRDEKNCQVVVKKLRVQRVHEKKKLQFQQEVKVFSSLNHPSIVQFYGACIETPNIAIVMEFLAGGSLHDVIHVERRGLSTFQKLQMTEDILSALKYIHDLDVAHRDIKAMNVLLCEDLNHCKLGDFGLALKESNESSLSVVDHGAVGTIRYSSPEILRGDRLTLSGCKAADIYAASITINEMFIEEIPFEELNQHQLRKVVLDGERPEPSNDNPLKVPLRLKLLLEQGMFGNVSARPNAASFWNTFQTIKTSLMGE